MPLAVSASLIPLMWISSCSTEARLKAAAMTQGTIQAGVALPFLPADCRKIEPHYAVREGDEARSIIVGERGALYRANARVGRCASFYDDVRDRFGKGPGQ